MTNISYAIVYYNACEHQCLHRPVLEIMVALKSIKAINFLKYLYSLGSYKDLCRSYTKATLKINSKSTRLDIRTHN